MCPRFSRDKHMLCTPAVSHIRMSVGTQPAAEMITSKVFAARVRELLCYVVSCHAAHLEVAGMFHV